MTKLNTGNRFKEVRPLGPETPIMGTTAEQVQACFAGETFASNLQEVVAKIKAREACEASAGGPRNSGPGVPPYSDSNAK